MGAIGCVGAFAISIVNERAYGTFLRLRIAPISRGQILAGKGSACFLACVIEIGLLLATGHFIFGVRLQNAASLALAIASTSAGFVGIMMLLSVLGKTEQAVAGAGWGILIVMAMFGGGMVPLMMMPGWMQRISHLSPVKWGILALEGAIWRGFTLVRCLSPARFCSRSVSSASAPAWRFYRAPRLKKNTAKTRRPNAAMRPRQKRC